MPHLSPRLIVPGLCIGILFTVICVTLAERQTTVARQTTTGEPSKVQIAGQFVHGEVNKDGLAAFLMPHKIQFKIGEPIPLSFGIVFIHPEPTEPVSRKIKVWRPMYPIDPLNYSWFEVKGPDGQEVPYTGANLDYGEFKPSADNCTLLYHGDLVGRTVDLCSMESFKIKSAGKYKVRWKYMGNDAPGIWSGQLFSNELEIDVVSD